MTGEHMFASVQSPMKPATNSLTSLETPNGRTTIPPKRGARHMAASLQVSAVREPNASHESLFGMSGAPMQGKGYPVQAAMFECTHCGAELEDELPAFGHIEAWPTCCGEDTNLMQLLDEEEAWGGGIQSTDTPKDTGLPSPGPQEPTALGG